MDETEGPAGSTDGRAARWQDHRVSRREELIQLARRAIHRLGPGVSMDEIASEAATSKSVIYRYFGGKDGLRQAVGQDVVQRLAVEVVGAGRLERDPVAALSAMIHIYLSQAAASPNTYAFVMAPGETGSDDAVNAFTADLTALMTERLTEMLAASGQDTSTQLFTLWPASALGLIRSAGEAWLLQEPALRPDTASLTASLTTWLVHGIAPTPGSSHSEPTTEITTASTAAPGGTSKGLSR